MRMGLVSDTHGDPTAWRNAMGVLGDLDLILHAGDVLYHGIFNPITETYEPRRLVELLNALRVPMVHARGNCDSEVDQLALHNHILSDFAFASVEGTRILVCHGHKWSDEALVGMAAPAGVRIVFRGHTHVPAAVEQDGVMLVNAGSCSLPKQEGGAPTVGLLEDGVITVFDTRSGAVFAKWEVP